MSHAKRLDKASTLFFFFGLISSKLQNIPIPLATLICKTVGLGFSLIGYILWTIASHLAPKHIKKKDAWYGFSQIKDQYQFSGIIGAVAIGLFFISIVVPVLFPVSCWLLALSNVVWCIGEFHKLRNPPTNDASYHPSKQNHYVNYAILITIASLITAIGYTVAVAFPPAFFPIIILTTAVALAFTLVGVIEWCHYFLGSYPTEKVTDSHTLMQEKLNLNNGLTIELGSDNEYSSRQSEEDSLPDQLTSNEQNLYESSTVSDHSNSGSSPQF